MCLIARGQVWICAIHLLLYSGVPLCFNPLMCSLAEIWFLNNENSRKLGEDPELTGTVRALYLPIFWLHLEISFLLQHSSVTVLCSLWSGVNGPRKECSISSADGCKRVNLGIWIQFGLGGGRRRVPFHMVHPLSITKEISSDKSIPPWSLPDKARLTRACTKVLTWLLLHNCNSQHTLKLGPVYCKCCPNAPGLPSGLLSHVKPVDRWQWKVRITSDPTPSSTWLPSASNCKHSYAMLICLSLY